MYTQIGRTLPVFLLLICCFSAGLNAQTASPPDSVWVVEMADGNTYSGTIVDEGGPTFRMITTLGELTLQRASVRSMRRVASGHLKDGAFWPENSHSTRHFWGPSGYGLREGQGYYQNTWIWLNQVSYGVSDYFSIGGGLIPLFFFNGAPTPVWITPKVSLPYKNGKGAFGAGTILAGLVGGRGSEGIGIAYGVNTFGTRDKQITAGLGWGYGTRSGWASRPTFSLAGQARTGRNWMFLSENYFISTGDDFILLASAGARYMGRRLAIDFGGVIPFVQDAEFFFIAPWLSLTVPFE